MNIEKRLREVLEFKEINCKGNTYHQLSVSLGTMVAFWAAKRIRESESLTPRNILDLIKSWKYEPSTQRVRIRQLRFLLKKVGRADLANEITLPRLDRSVKVFPYSDADIKAFCAATEDDPLLQLFFKTSIATGAAVADLVQLTPANLQDGHVRFHRQKTKKECIVPVSAELYGQLRLALPFYRPKYAKGVYGVGSFATGTKIWSDKMRNAQIRAGIYIKDQLCHRGRDTFVEKSLANGVSLQNVAFRLGDLLTTVQAHYSSLISPRMMEMNLSAPAIQI